MKRDSIRAHSITALSTAFAIAIMPIAASAENIIKQPTNHPSYRYELEPHATFALFHRAYGPYSFGRYSGFGDPEIGVGFRASIELADPAFVRKINNNVAISFGLDLTPCRYCYRDFALWLPIGMQWNFFLTEHWSVFPDLGLMPRTDGFFDHTYLDFYGMAGARYHFNDKTTLTMRFGYPFISVGVSFFGGR